MNYRLVWFEHIFTVLMKWDWVQVLKLSIPNTRLTNRFKIMIYLDAKYCTYNITKVKFLITHVDTACY